MLHASLRCETPFILMLMSAAASIFLLKTWKQIKPSECLTLKVGRVSFGSWSFHFYSFDKLIGRTELINNVAVAAAQTRALELERPALGGMVPWTITCMHLSGSE